MFVWVDATAAAAAASAIYATCNLLQPMRQLLQIANQLQQQHPPELSLDCLCVYVCVCVDKSQSQVCKHHKDILRLTKRVN